MQFIGLNADKQIPKTVAAQSEIRHLAGLCVILSDPEQMRRGVEGSVFYFERTDSSTSPAAPLRMTDVVRNWLPRKTSIEAAICLQ